MNEIKELFDMVTDRKEPDQDAWKQQETRQRRTARNRRIGAFAGAAAVVLLAVLAVALLGRWEEGSPAAPPSDTPSPTPTHYAIDVTTGDRSAFATALPGARLAEVSPDGRSIAWDPCCGYDPLSVTSLDGSSESVTVTPPGLDGYDPSWIDDERILFQGRDSGTDELGDLYVANVTTGDVHKAINLPDERRPAWIVVSDISPDGRTVLFGLPRGKPGHEQWDLWTASLASGKPTRLRKDAGFAAYAPDGSIVFLDHPSDFVATQIWVMNGDGSNARHLVTRGTFSYPSVSPDGSMVAYGNEGKAEVVDVATGAVTPFDVFSEAPTWDGNDTLIVDDGYHTL